MTEIADILQSDTPVGSSQVVLFIPSKDRDGQEIDQEYWVNEDLRVIGQAFREGTVFPPAKGSGAMTSAAVNCCLKRR